MSTILREIAVKLGLEADAHSFAEGELLAEGLEKALEKVVDWAKETAEAFVEMAKEAILTADRLDKTSQAVGLTTTALQELQHAGALGGVSAEEMSIAIEHLSRNMYNAAKGGEEQAKAFAKLGVKVKDGHGKLRAADEVMADIAEKFKSMPDGAEKTALSMEAFGRAGARMVPMLNEGRAGLEELRQEARDLGLVLDETTIKQGVAIKDNIERLQGMWEGIKNKAGATVFPVLKKLTDGMIAWIKTNKEIIRQKLEVVLRTMAKAATILYDALMLVINNFGAIKIALISLITLWAIFNAAAVAAAISTIAAWAAAAAPFVAIAAGIAGILLFLDDIRRYREGKGKTLFGLWADTIKEWQKPNANDPWWLRAIKELVVYMEKALGIAHKLGVVGGNSKPGSTTPAFSGTIPISGGRNISVPTPYIAGKNPYDDLPEEHWVHKLRRFVGTEPELSTAISPMLPAGSGVRAPTQQVNQRTYNIYQSPGMSPQEVYSIIEQHEDAANESAAAAIGE